MGVLDRVKVLDYHSRRKEVHIHTVQSEISILGIYMYLAGPYELACGIIYSRLAVLVLNEQWGFKAGSVLV